MGKRTPNTTCIVCGEGFYNRPSTPNRKTCSRACNVLARKMGLIKSGRTAKNNAECYVCGKEFYRAPSHQKRSKSGKLFCSIKCQHEAQKKPVTKECLECGKSFTTIPAKAETQKYCSFRCSHKALVRQNDTRIEKECVICGEKFLTPLNRNKKFCSKKCMGKAHQQRFIEDKEFVTSWAKSLKSPNKLENLFDEHTPYSIKFTGDGKVWITFTDGKLKNPDFVVDGTTKVIEIFGDYWHKDEDTSILVEQYREVGYECLVLWESEIKSDLIGTLLKVIRFIETA